MKEQSDTAAGSAQGPPTPSAPGLWRSTAVLAACVIGVLWLGRAALDATSAATEGPLALDAVVAAAALGVGTVACAVLGVGASLLAGAALARVAGRSARGLEAAAARVTPAVVRRAVAVTLTTSVGLTGAASASSATEIDLGWEVTTQSEADADPVETVELTTANAATAVVVRPASTPVREEVPDDPPPAPTVTVAPGDSLWAIAAAHLPDGATDAEVAEAWPRWYALNEQVIGADPDLIRPGQQLLVPGGLTTEESR